MYMYNTCYILWVYRGLNQFLCVAGFTLLVQCHAFWASGSDSTGCGREATCPSVCFMTVDRKEANTARSIDCLQEGNTAVVQCIIGRAGASPPSRATGLNFQIRSIHIAHARATGKRKAGSL